MMASPKDEPRQPLAMVRTINVDLDRQRREFLAGKGWPDDVLLTNQMAFCPNVPPQGVAPVWHLKFRPQLRGHDYRSIPYFDLSGEPLIRHIPLAGQLLPFVRARLLDYDKKEGKYQSYAGAGVAIYAPRTQANWSEIAADAGVPIAITEGEDKAIAGCLAGVPTLGISGVDCLVSKGVIAEPCGPEAFVWKDRTVMVVFDQDEESTYDKPWKASVAAGADRCASHLVAAGALPVFAYIARTEVGKAHAGQKLGLDDYLRAGGTIDDLFSEQTTQRADQTSVLAHLLLRYGMTDKGDVLDAETGALLSLAKLKPVYAAHFEVVRVNGNERKVMAIDRWVAHPSRVTIPHDGIVLDPALPPGFVDGCKYNQWQGFAVVPAAVPHPEAIAAFEQLGSRLFNESWPWVLGWMAHMLQRPGEKAMQGVICKSGVQGIGKSLICEILQALIGPTHAAKVQPDKLFHKFGTHVRGRVFLYCDELQSDYARHEDTLKDMITSFTWEVEEKGVNMVVVPNLARFMVTTNKPYAVKMDGNARRLLVECPSITEAEKRSGWQAWVQEVAVRLKRDPEWQASLMAYLLSVDIEACGYRPDMDAPWTIHRSEMARASDSPLDAEAERVNALLPERFALTPGMRQWTVDGKSSKHVIDLVCNSAVYKAETTLRIDGKPTQVVVYDKANPLPMEERPRSDRGVRRVLAMPPDQVRELLAGTKHALGRKYT